MRVMRASAAVAKAASTAVQSRVLFISLSSVDLLAGIAGGQVDVACAVVNSFFGIGAVRARAAGLGADDGVRREVALHPVDDRGQPVDRGVADAAAAVRHPR